MRTQFFDRARYELQLLGRRVIMTPIVVMIGFALFAELLQYLKVNPARFLSGGLEIILPLATAVIVVTIVSHDPTIELQLTMPKQYSMTVMSRLFLVVGWTVVIALLSSIVVSLLKLIYMPQVAQPYSAPTEFFLRQLVWFAPLLWLVAVGLCLAMLIRSRSAAAALLCGAWLLEIVMKDYIFITDWLRPMSLFPTTLVFPSRVVPQIYFDMWLTSRFEVLGTAFLLLPLGWLLLRNPEGLLKGTGEE